jgi:hypothetical protein
MTCSGKVALRPLHEVRRRIVGTLAPDPSMQPKE